MRTAIRRRSAPVAAVVLAGVLFALATAPSASAHAILVSSRPANGVVVKRSPGQALQRSLERARKFSLKDTARETLDVIRKVGRS